MRIALVRHISDRINDCELTHMTRDPIEVDRARAQHTQYIETLKALGCHVIELPADDSHPDCVFIEDTAVVLHDLAIMTRPGVESRRGEGGPVEDVLAPYRRVERIIAPGTLDGGDVIVDDRQIYVGRSSRTNDAGIEQLAELAAPSGYTVTTIDVNGCLHLKTAGTLVSDGTILMNRLWADATRFNGHRFIDTHPDEPFAGNAVRIGDAVIMPEAFVNTRRAVEQRGITVHTAPNAELAKAEGGVTCCSIIFEADWKPRLVE